MPANFATVSDEELQHTRAIFADLVAEGRVLDPSSALDRAHARGIIPAMVELIDEVLRQRAWARGMVEKAASGGTLDGYRELGQKLAKAEAQIEALRAERDVLKIGIDSVLHALARAGVSDVDDPGEAIDTIAAEREALRADKRRIEGMAQHMVATIGIGNEPLYVFATPILRKSHTADDLRAAVDAALEVAEARG